MPNLNLLFLSFKAYFLRTSVHSKYTIYILAGILTYLCLPPTYLQSHGEGLDDSWKQGLLFAFEQHMNFGNDFLFTYGPLGFLQTRYLGNSNIAYLLTFDLFIRFAFFLFFVIFLRKSNEKIHFVHVVIACHFLCFNYDDIMNIMILFLFYLFNNEKSTFKLSACLALILAALAFFIKVNIGLLLWMVLFVKSIYFSVSEKENRIFWVAICSVQLVSMFVLPNLLNVNLLNYIIGSFHIIQGYNDAMAVVVYPYVYPNYDDPIWMGTVMIALFAAVEFLVLVVAAIVSSFDVSKNLRIRNVLMNGILLTFTFVIFKQSFVRFDKGHLMVFFTYIPFIVLLFCHFIGKDFKKLETILLTASVVSILNSQIFIGNIGNLDFSRYSNFNFSQDKGQNETNPNSKFSAQLLDKLKNDKTDIFPFDIAYLISNNIAYHPRPVIQSYSVYDAYLMKKNADFYNDHLTSPSNVIFSSKSIDFKYPFWDDEYAKLKLLEKFHPVESFNIKEDNFLLLKKKSEGFFKLDTVHSYQIMGKLNTDIEIPRSSGLISILPEIKYTLAGKLIRTAFQPSKLGAKLTYANGENQTFKAVLPILKAGVICNYRLVNGSDMQNFYSHHFEKLMPVLKIKFICSSDFYQEEFKIKVYELKLTPVLESEK